MVRKFWERLRGLTGTTGKKSFVLTTVSFFLTSVALTLLLLWLGTLTFSFRRWLVYFRNPVVMFLNYLPVGAVMLILYLLCNRMWLAFLGTSILGYLLVFTNHFKVKFRGEPFVAMDLMTLAEGANAGGEFSIVLPTAFWTGVVCILCGIIFLVFVAKWRIPGKAWFTRPLLILLTLAFAQFMWDPYYNDEELYISYHMDDLYYFDDWKMPERASKRGVIYSFVYSVSDTIVQEPANYDPKMVEDILSEYDTEPIPEDCRINVQIHMLETYADLSKLGFSFRKDPYESWHKLEEESYHGTLVTDVLGGGTINTERSVMTGFTFAHPSYSVPTNSFIRYFNESGYFTQFTHPGNSWFYNREAINGRLGFASTLFEENYFNQFPGVFHGKDEDLFPILRNLYLENTSKGEPYFAFHLTYQNHSPYDSEVLLGDEYISDERLDVPSYNALNNYLFGIEATGNAIAAYVDRFREDEEPVIMVFFGDHKATLGENNSIYEALGVNISTGTSEGCYNLYTTPYLIWANDAAKEFLGKDVKGEGPVISSCYLMNELFDICDWKGNAWLQYQDGIQETIPVIHRRMTLWVDGNLTKDFPDEINSIRLQRNRVEFYWRYNLK